MNDSRYVSGSRLSGRVALVTGAASGLGAACARIFAEEGASVVLTDIDVESGEALAKELGSACAFIEHDVTSRDGWLDAIALAEREFGAVSVLVNNAGIFDAGPIETFEEAAYRRVIDINQVGPFLGMQTIIPSMRKAGGGSIINMSSVSGLVGAPHACAYNASKFALRGMTKVAALELGVDGIRVNSVHPGMIATPMTTKFGPATGQPLFRPGLPEEVARMVLFLASDESSFCTSAEFVIDGGQTSTFTTQTVNASD